MLSQKLAHTLELHTDEFNKDFFYYVTIESRQRKIPHYPKHQQKDTTAKEILQLKIGSN